MLYTQWKYDEALSVEREEAFVDGREAGEAIDRAVGIAEDIQGRIEDVCRWLRNPSLFFISFICYKGKLKQNLIVLRVRLW